MTNQELLLLSIEASDKLKTCLAECDPDSQLYQLLDSALWGLEDLEHFLKNSSGIA